MLLSESRVKPKVLWGPCFMGRKLRGTGRGEYFSRKQVNTKPLRKRLSVVLASSVRGRAE